MLLNMPQHFLLTHAQLYLVPWQSMTACRSSSDVRETNVPQRLRHAVGLPELVMVGSQGENSESSEQGVRSLVQDYHHLSHTLPYHQVEGPLCKLAEQQTVSKPNPKTAHQGKAYVG
jgi:hypothetical protein